MILVAVFLNWFPKGGVLLVLAKGSGQPRFLKNWHISARLCCSPHYRMNADLHVFPFDCSVASSLKSPKRLHGRIA